MAKKNGRPSICTEAVVEEICSRLSAGESLNAICEDAHLPERQTVHRWVVIDHEGFSSKYTRARQSQALRWAEEIMSIADNDSKDWRVDEQGNLVVDREDVQRSRLRVDTRKWMLSKMLPKVYGDKQSLELAGVDGAPIITEITRRIIHVKKP